MIKLNIHEAMTYLSRYIEKVEDGETILLCKRNQPVAEIRAVAVHPRNRRTVGLAKAMFIVPDSFFEELPGEMVALFYGKAALC